MMIQLLLYYYLFCSFILCGEVLFSTVRLSGVRNDYKYFVFSKIICIFAGRE